MEFALEPLNDAQGALRRSFFSTKGAKMVECECLQCANPFRALRRTKLYCTSKCARRAAYLRTSRLTGLPIVTRNDYRDLAKTYRSRVGTCDECKTEFDRYRPYQKFCSDICRNRFFRNARRNELIELREALRKRNEAD